MALQTKTVETTSSNGYTLRLSLSEDSTSVANNTSTISYTLTLLSGSYNYGQFGTGYSVTINGTVVKEQLRSAGIQTSIAKNSSLTLCSGSTTVTHGTDGTKTTTVAATLDIAGSPGPGPMSIASTSWTLTTIPRKSTLTVSNGTLGTALSMTVTAASSSFTHNITYKIGSGSATTMFSGVGSGAQSYTFPKSLASNNTSGTSIAVTLTLTTLNGGSSIGSNTYNITMTIPNDSDTKPTIGTITVTDVDSRVATYGAYVQNNSRISVSASPSAKYSATIASKTIQIKSGSTVLYSSSANITNYKLANSGTITILVTATDSRGFSNSASTTISVLAYSAPAISSVTLTRTNSGGSAQSGGTYGTIKFSATGSSLSSNNTMTYKIYYKTSSASSYSNATMSSYSNNFSVSNGTYTFAASASNSFNAYITAQDKFNTTTSIVVYMPSGYAYLHLDAPDNALSIGKVELIGGTFCVGMYTQFDKDITINNNATIANLKVPSAKYYTTTNAYGLDMNNSDIIKANGIYFADASDQPFNEGIHFYRSGDKYDTIYCRDGNLFLMPNHTRTANTSAYTVLNTNNMKRYITSKSIGSNYWVTRWNDGLQEFWAIDKITVSSWNAWGNLYESNTSKQYSYGSWPFKKYTHPVVMADGDATFGICGLEPYRAASSCWQYSPKYYALRPNNTQTGDVYISIYAVGMWTSSENLIPPIGDHTYSGVTSTVYPATGYTKISGTATATGGHGTLISDSVTLSAGTYQVEVTISGGDTVCTDYWIRSSSTNHVQITTSAKGTYTGTFTLSAETSVYAGVRVTNGTTYSGYVIASIYKTS